MNDFYNPQYLANAIVKQAADDYRNALRGLVGFQIRRNRFKEQEDRIIEKLEVLKKYFWWETEVIRQWERERQTKRNRQSELQHKLYGAEITIRECERFFKSGYYQLLTNVDGDYIVKRIREEVENELKHRKRQAKVYKRVDERNRIKQS